jgi:spermidine synthase
VTEERRDHLAIALISFAVMVFQITLTRVLSVVVWYHWAFLSISLVMLGLGVPGVVFCFVQQPQRYLRGLLIAAGVATPLAVALVVQLGASVIHFSVLLVIACVLPVTLTLGGAVCLLLMKAPGERVSRMYGADLLGAGLGAAAVIPMMHLVPTPDLAAAMGACPLLALVLQSEGRSRTPWILLAALGLLCLWEGPFEVTRTKNYDESELGRLYVRWTPTARLAVFDGSFFTLQHKQGGFVWGGGEQYESGEVRQYWIEQDAGAGTPITRFDGDFDALGFLDYDVTTVGYQLTHPRRVAIIGTGGGRDILSALKAGADSVDAIELNGATVETVSSRFREFSGDVYHLPGVRAVVSEGRSYLTRSVDRYDLLQISLTDSFAASAAGAFTLSEANLYTVEAFELFLARLAEGGVLSTSRWNNETPRLLMTAQAALRRRGVAEPKSQLAVVSGAAVSTLLVFDQPPPPEVFATLLAISKQRGFELRYPALEQPTQIARVVEQGVAHIERHGFDLSPPRDDSPFFFHTLPVFQLHDAAKTSTHPEAVAVAVLQTVMFVVTLAAAAFFLLPFAVFPRRAEGLRITGLWRGSLFFAAIGAGFMLTENALVQRFILYLGHPSYAITVVLAAILLGMGAGSSASARLGLGSLQSGGLVVALLLFATAASLDAFFSATLGLPLAARAALSLGLLVPVGAVLGLFFPLGMLRFGDAGKPWFWALNGVFGVVASVFSLALAMEFGFRATAYAGAACYVLAWWALRGRVQNGDVG